VVLATTGEEQGIRFGRIAVLFAAVALAVPVAAQADNEVTKWNEIAVNTVNAQPPLLSAPRIPGHERRGEGCI
jgi:hypothetical protein